MSSRRNRFGSRRLLLVSVLLGIFVLFDLGLLGWLIFRSLSKREVDRTLVEARNEARGLAEELGQRLSLEEDLYTAVAKEREVKRYIDSVLRQRTIVQTVEIYDREGHLVFRNEARSDLPVPGGGVPTLEVGELPQPFETVEESREDTFDVSELNEPIGELGFVKIGLSQTEIRARIENLRTELVRQTVLIGAVTLVVLGLGYLTIWWLWRRGRRLEEKAREAERLAYLGTLASGLAHEIRNPLNSLNLNMQLLAEEPAVAGTSGSTQRLLAITRSEIGRLERLVTDFLQYAKPRPLELTEVPAADLLHRSKELLALDLVRRGVDLEVEDRSSGATVCVDPERLGQLLLNLVQNALAATEDSERAPEIRLVARREGGEVLLEVLDNGVGIPAERLEKIFDLFYSTRKGGTGLGLAVVKRIAESHAGEVKIQSTPGVGTRVQLILPECPPPADATEPASGHQPRASTA